MLPGWRRAFKNNTVGFLWVDKKLFFFIWNSPSLSDTSLYLASGCGMYLKPFPCCTPLVCAFIFSHRGLELPRRRRPRPLRGACGVCARTAKVRSNPIDIQPTWPSLNPERALSSHVLTLWDDTAFCDFVFLYSSVLGWSFRPLEFAEVVLWFCVLSSQ